MMATFRHGRLASRQPVLEIRHNPFGDLVLDGKHIVGVAVELLGPQVIAVVCTDQLHCGEPLPSLLPPWCGDARTKVRGRLFTGQFQTTDDRVSGTMQLVLNMNLDASSHGPAWGSLMIEVPARGTWEGGYQGKFEGFGVYTYRLVAHGSGEFDGLELRAVVVWQAGQGESWTGEIIDTRPQR
jgi:hypothetical protein